MRRLRPFLLLVVGALLLLTSGCPLDIRVRCDESHACARGEVCDDGDCVVLDGSRMGEACAVAGNCGPGYLCNPSWAGGYCTVECSAANPCPRGGVCAVELGLCFRSCDQGCTRAAQECRRVPGTSSPVMACLPRGECEGAACPDGGTDGGVDGGCSGPGCADGGGEACWATVELGGLCTRACECEAAAAACEDGRCTMTCESDFGCREGRRCTNGRCEVGPRIGEACKDVFDCGGTAQCHPERKRCEERCNFSAGGGICDEGYRCASDDVCVVDCSDAPTTVGLSCENSLDCARCGECLPSEQGLRCRRLCRQDRDCPGGAAGACELVGVVRACRL